MKLRRGCSENDSNDCRSDYREYAIEAEMAQPEPQRIRKPVRELHGLNCGTSLLRGVQGEKSRENTLFREGRCYTECHCPSHLPSQPQRKLPTLMHLESCHPRQERLG